MQNSKLVPLPIDLIDPPEPDYSLKTRMMGLGLHDPICLPKTRLRLIESFEDHGFPSGFPPMNMNLQQATVLWPFSIRANCHQN
jgi:hypothetical protein